MGANHRTSPIYKRMNKQIDEIKSDGTVIDPFNMTTEEVMETMETAGDEGDKTPTETPTEKKEEEEETPSSEGEKEETSEEETEEETTEEVEETEEEIEEEEETPEKKSEEEQAPFHEHPRFKELVDEKNTYKKELDDLKTLVEDVQTQQNEKPGEIPQKFVEVFGEDPEAFNLFTEMIKNESAKTVNAFIKQQEESQVQQEQDRKSALDYTNSELERLESKGNKFDREELKKTMIKFQPTKTEDGETILDFDKGLEILNINPTVKSTVNKKVRKKVVNTDNQTSPSEETDEIYTPQSFGRWRRPVSEDSRKN